MNPGERMRTRLIEMIHEYDNPHQMAACKGLSHGLVYNGLCGVWSDTLAEQIGLRKWPKRDGIFISCSEEMKARYDSQCGDMSRTEHLARLMDAWDGIGEMEI